MTVREIIRRALIEMGADGLCDSEAECGCRMDDLCWCGVCNVGNCVPAVYGPPPEGFDPEEYPDWMVPMPDPSIIDELHVTEALEIEGKRYCEVGLWAHRPAYDRWVMIGRMHYTPDAPDDMWTAEVIR